MIVHLWVWQQSSIARMDGGLHDLEPEFPNRVAELHAEWDDNSDQTNAWIYKTFHIQSWSTVYQDWRGEFLRFLELGEPISEKDLLDGSRYPWLEGYSLAFILVASYDHHQEHLEKLTDWLQEYRK